MTQAWLGNAQLFCGFSKMSGLCQQRKVAKLI